MRLWVQPSFWILSTLLNITFMRIDILAEHPYMVILYVINIVLLSFVFLIGLLKGSRT